MRYTLIVVCEKDKFKIASRSLTTALQVWSKNNTPTHVER